MNHYLCHLISKAVTMAESFKIKLHKSAPTDEWSWREMDDPTEACQMEKCLTPGSPLQGTCRSASCSSLPWAHLHPVWAGTAGEGEGVKDLHWSQSQNLWRGDATTCHGPTTRFLRSLAWVSLCITVYLNRKQNKNPENFKQKTNSKMSKLKQILNSD